MDYVKSKKEETASINTEINKGEEEETYFFDDFVKDKITYFYKLKRISYRTKQRHETCIHSLLKFHEERYKKEKKLFSVLTKKYIEKIESYFQDKYESNTLNKFIQTIRKYTTLALKEKLINRDPFDGYTYRNEKTKERAHLTKFEISKENIDKELL